MSEPRPDPDELLRRVKRRRSPSAGAASSRIFFGFAPGVGKTYRMLQVAPRLATQQRRRRGGGRGRDPRAAPRPRACSKGSKRCRASALEYRGRTLEEFDLDAALARRPGLLLVDELAHTNAPGSRHAKRWQDVIELLDAGIDVLHDPQRAARREPERRDRADHRRASARDRARTRVLDRADEIELVDITPERAACSACDEGKVYLPEQAAARGPALLPARQPARAARAGAAAHGRARRSDVQEYREEHGVATTWPPANASWCASGRRRARRG